MELQIISNQNTPSGKYFEAAVGKIAGYVWIGAKSGFVTVCCQNASNRVWGKGGRHFRTIEEAMAAYKSPQMKAIITAAKEA